VGFDAVSDSDPIDRPWNPLKNATSRGRFVA
jgi:hypothetical protein